MKFIHTSDWHIGRQFHSVSLLEDQRHVLDQLLGYIGSKSIDALVIAGDIYDRSIPPSTAVELLDDFLAAITLELKVPVILIPGNHDSAERLSFGSQQLRQAGLHIMGDLNKVTEPVIITHEEGDVAFYGVPYNDPTMVRHLSDEAASQLGQRASYDEAHTYLVEKILSDKPTDIASVLISHCFIDGADASESERPLSIGGSDRVSYQPCLPFDYVALGHLHSPQYKGEKHIRYSGSLLKYSFSERNHVKGVTLVDVNAQGLQSIEHLPLKPLRDMRVIEGELATIVEQGKTDPNKEDYLLVRLTDRHAILEPMAKLRAVYPNVLQLEKPGMLETGEQEMSREKLKYSELDMFRDFFVQVTGQALSSEQDDALQQTITEINKQETSA